MVSRILFLFMLIIPFISFSQNLAFSEVKLVSTLETVPEGKVWKITNVLSTLSGSGDVIIKVNDNEIITAFSKSSNGQTGGTGNFHNNHNYFNSLEGAFWLPSGTTLEAWTNTQYISVLEFNTD